MQNDRADAPTPMVFWAIWGALTASIVIYLVVLQVVRGTPPEEGPDGTLVVMFSGLAVVNLAVAFGVRLFHTNRIARRREPEKRAALLSACIISWALAEAVAIYGLVLGFLGAAESTSHVFFLVAFTAMLFLTPRFRE